MTDYSFILSKNYSDKQWSMNGDDYDGLTWLDESPQPSQEQLDQEYISYKRATDYIYARQDAYLAEGLTMQELTVAAWEKLIEGRPEASDVLQLKRLAVKARFPKPSEE